MEGKNIANGLSERKQKIFCENCGISFAARKSLYRHVKKLHPTETISYYGYKICCPVCDDKCRSVVDLQDHFQTQHLDIQLNFETQTFYCRSDFEDWKTRIEGETLSYFTRHGSVSYLSDGTVSEYYHCNRSGSAALKRDGRKRRLKNGGSIKIGKTCPATIKVYDQRVEEAQEITVEYQSVHVGHNMEVKKLPLSKTVKDQLVTQLKMGSSKSEILTNMRKASSPSKREFFINRKDLHNICRNFKIDNETNVNLVHIINEQGLVHEPDHVELVNEIRKATYPSDIEIKKSIVVSKFENLLQRVKSDEEIDMIDELLTELENRMDGYGFSSGNEFSHGTQVYYSQNTL